MGGQTPYRQVAIDIAKIPPQSNRNFLCRSIRAEVKLAVSYHPCSGNALRRDIPLVAMLAATDAATDALACTATKQYIDRSMNQ